MMGEYYDQTMRDFARAQQSYENEEPEDECACESCDENCQLKNVCPYYNW